jgi:hydroxymethylpyrimidine pyrophosphatase-like HAD family hydrolase
MISGGEQLTNQPITNYRRPDDFLGFLYAAAPDPVYWIDNPLLNQYSAASYQLTDENPSFLFVEPQVAVPYIYIDLNGSVLDEERETHVEFMRPSSVEAISAYLACGGRLGIATGYTTDEILHYLGSGYGQIQPNLPIITFNGAVMFRPHYNIDGELVEQEILNVRPIDPEAADYFIERARNTEGILAIVVYGALHTVVDYPENIVNYLERTHVRNPIEDPDLILPIDDQIVKISAVVSEERGHDYSQRRTRITESLRQGVLDSALLIPRRPGLDFVGRNAVKEEAIAFIGDLSGFDLSEIYYVGEGHNDINILGAAGYGLAMGNCIPEACAQADEIIGTNHTDAFADWLIEQGLTATCHDVCLPR